MSLAVSIFLLVLLTELISWIGQSLLVELAFAGYLRIFHSTRVAEQRRLKTEILANKAELLKTSAQDQFARWAKLRRAIDKGLAELDKLNKELGTTRSAFSIQFNSFLWTITTGAEFALGWWYRKAAVFYLPPGWLGPLAWWLALPFAPAGSVSCGVWQMSCRRVIKVFEGVVRDLVSARSSQTEENGVPPARAEVQ